jgi:serine/threonine-protein kinase RsbW
MRLRVAALADQRAPLWVRRRLRAWLDELGWPEDDRDDLVLATSEAVSNVVDHAYPPGHTGTAHVEARHIDGPRRTRRVIIRVRDNGRWRDPPDESENRRRGLPLMRALTAAMRLDTTSAGTCVELISAAVPRSEAR